MEQQKAKQDGCGATAAFVRNKAEEFKFRLFKTKRQNLNLNGSRAGKGADGFVSFIGFCLRKWFFIHCCHLD